MTLYEFRLLDEAEQLEAIWEKSTKLAERRDNTFLYILYQVDNFYVEEKISKEQGGRHAFNSFASTEAAILKPYLEQISIKELIGK